jgi:hypothetical protein
VRERGHEVGADVGDGELADGADGGSAADVSDGELVGSSADGGSEDIDDLRRLRVVRACSRRRLSLGRVGRGTWMRYLR